MVQSVALPFLAFTCLSQNRILNVLGVFINFCFKIEPKNKSQII